MSESAYPVGPKPHPARIWIRRRGHAARPSEDRGRMRIAFATRRRRNYFGRTGVSGSTPELAIAESQS